MLIFDKKSLKTTLENLSPQSRLAFLLLLCERMLPDLLTFSVDTGYSSQPYCKCLDMAWKSLANGATANDVNLINLPDPPDSEEFDHPLSEAALDATLAIESVQSFLKAYDLDEIIDVARRARDIAANNVSDKLPQFGRSRELEDIMVHPIMQEELRRQRADLRFIESLIPPIDHLQIKRIKDWLKLPKN